MVRLKVDFGNRLDSFVGYLRKLADFDMNVDIKYYQSFTMWKYKYLYNLDIFNNKNESCSMSIGINLNGNNEPTIGFIEFNPNKCFNIFHFQEIWTCIFYNYLVTSELTRYDLSIDIPLTRTLCRLVKDSKKTYQYIVKDDGVTEYLGQRNKDGFIKLYDKSIESDLDYPLTRLEITLSPQQDISSVFPKVYIFDSQASFILDGLSQNDIVLVDLLRSIDDFNVYFRRFSRRKRKKIEPYLVNKILSLDDSAAKSIKQQALSFELF